MTKTVGWCFLVLAALFVRPLSYVAHTQCVIVDKPEERFAQAQFPPSSPAQAAVPEFGDFPVREVFRGTPAAPVLATPEARRFRTELTRQAAGGPNFAGFYTLARWGCGAGCVTGAIIDARTGQVWFPGFRVEDLITAQGKITLHHGVGSELDSELLIAEGVINEQGAGKAYFRWHDNTLKLIRFDRLK